LDHHDDHVQGQPVSPMSGVTGADEQIGRAPVPEICSGTALGRRAPQLNLKDEYAAMRTRL
jgi:hypothetical protein